MKTSFLLDLIYPPKCPFCQKLLQSDENGLCRACSNRYLHQQPENISGDWFFVCIHALNYDGEVRDAILRYKFQGRRCYAEAFGHILYEAVRRAGLQWDLITWAPVSAKRRRRRGYDQAELLCRRLAALQNTVPVSVLRKCRNNPAQSTLKNAAQRAQNVRNVYTVTDASAVTGRRILLIDDIITTGSTLSECSRVLLQAGAESVLCAALAGQNRKSPQTDRPA